MQPKGDIPEEIDVSPPKDAQLSPSALAKVAMVDEIIANGGVAHVYLDSVTVGAVDNDEDIHIHDFNSYRYVDSGWIYLHADDKDVWIAGSDIGTIERHYES